VTASHPARQLVAAGHAVYVGARDPECGREAAERLGARFVHLDVTDDALVAAAVAGTRLGGKERQRAWLVRRVGKAFVDFAGFVVAGARARDSYQ